MMIEISNVASRQGDNSLVTSENKFGGNFKSRDKDKIARSSKFTELRILLADDDEDDRMFFTDAINSIVPDTKLTTAQDGEELINRLKKYKSEIPNFIFLDMNMPYKNGLECLQEIKSMEFYKNVPVLIYSTSTNKDQVDTTYRYGANLYIQKPVNFEGIKRVLNIIFSFDPEKWAKQPSRDQFIIK